MTGDERIKDTPDKHQKLHEANERIFNEQIENFIQPHEGFYNEKQRNYGNQRGHLSPSVSMEGFQQKSKDGGNQ
jgi:hypothetical protein